MKTESFIILGCTSLFLWGSQLAQAETLSGKFHLTHQSILVVADEKYHGQIDLGDQLPLGDDFVLTNVTVTFKFQDDPEWEATSRDHKLSQTGKTVRRKATPLQKKNIAGRTDHYFQSTDIVIQSNEEEVAKLIIGKNIYFGTSIRRRDVAREKLGQKSMILGTYGDPGDKGNIRDHYRVTEMVRETRQDGFDGPFEIKRKNLDLASMQDLARTGLLEFTLGGQGDYIFTAATVQYHGYTTASNVPGGVLFKGVPSWFGLVSLPLGGLLWWTRKTPSQKNRGQQRKNQQGSARPIRHSRSGSKDRLKGQ